MARAADFHWQEETAYCWNFPARGRAHGDGPLSLMLVWPVCVGNNQLLCMARVRRGYDTRMALFSFGWFAAYGRNSPLCVS